MNNQRSTTEHKTFGLRTAVVFMLMLVALVCCFAVSVSAATVNGNEVVITQADLKFENQNGVFVHAYDGQTDVTSAFKFTNDTTELKPTGVNDDVKFKIKKATLENANAGDTFVVIEFERIGTDEAAYGGSTSAIRMPAKVTPIKLTWNGTAPLQTAEYEINKSVYSFQLSGIESLINFGGKTPDATFSVHAAPAVFEGVTRPADGYETAVEVDLGGNYIIDPLPVKANITKIQLEAKWDAKYEFIYRDPAAFNLMVLLKGKNQNISFEVPADYRTTNGADIADFAGNVGTYRIYVESPDAAIYEIVGRSYSQLSIEKKCYSVTMNDLTVVGDADSTSGANTPVHKLGVLGVSEALPQEILDAIVYMADGKVFNGTSAYGATKVTAILPASDNYYFEMNGETVTELNATLYISRRYVATGSAADTFDVIVYGEKGFAHDLEVKVETPELERHVLRGFPIHKEFTLSLKGDIGTEPFVLLIPVTEKMFSRHVDPLSVDNLYVYDAIGDKLVKASEVYTVTLEDGYYKVEGYTGVHATTFVIAPDYNTPFWLTAPGIALIILIVLAILAILFLVGLKLRKIAATRKDNAPSTIDTVGEGYDGEDVLVDSEATPIINVDELEADTETAEEKAAREAREAIIEERTQDAVEDAIDDLTEEASQIELPEEDTALADEATDAMANKLAEELGESVDADLYGDADADEVNAAVAEAMDAALNESADATDAVELVVEEEPEAVEAMAAVVVSDENEDDDNDGDDDDDDDDLGGFGGMAGLTFIDVQAEPEAYNEMLAQERDGLIKIVYRYRKSFTSRMIQSQGNVQDYYSAIKNLLLSYKGIKGRISWNYEAFNRGRVHVAKLNAKTKTLYLYLALNPEELADTKYGIVDMSSKKKYASVPVLMKIKGDRKFKYALELIEKLCGEDLALKQIENAEEVDYHMDFKTADELVEEGVMKKFAAAISLAPETEEEAPAAEEEAVAADAVVAEEAVAVDEAVAEESVAEESAANEATEEASEEAPATEETVEEDK